jgi:ethanolamine utilization protein EutN
MFIGKVTGTVVASQKIDSVVGKKLLLVQALNVKGDPPETLEITSKTAVAIDTVGAGEGEYVLVTQGSSARLTETTNKVPADAVVVGIIDSIQAGTTEVFKKPS